MPLPKFNLSKLKASVSAQQKATRNDIRNLLLLDRLQAQIRKESNRQDQTKKPLKEDWVRCRMLLSFANKNLIYGIFGLKENMFKDVYRGENLNTEVGIKSFIEEYFTLFENEKIEEYFEEAPNWKDVHNFSKAIFQAGYGEVMNSIEIMAVGNTELKETREISIVFDFHLSKYVQNINASQFMTIYSNTALRSFDIGDVDNKNLDDIDTTFVTTMNEIDPDKTDEHEEQAQNMRYDDLYIYLGLDVGVSVIGGS